MPHWEALGKYNEAYGSRYYTLTHRGVKFNQFVGVIQVGALTIEILPKIGRGTEVGSHDTWQRVLLEMLRTCHWLNVHAHETAHLSLKHTRILDAYLELFLTECERIVHRGLVKKYHQDTGNRNALKGRLLFHHQIAKNLVHQERFFTRHQVFDHNHVLNQILITALRVIPVISASPLLMDRVHALLLTMPELPSLKVTPATFDKLKFDRRTSHYREALDIAAMLLLNYRPDIVGGGNNVLAILFDMNQLWEEYLYHQISKHRESGWVVKKQNRRPFWHSNLSGRAKIIKPDILISDCESDKVVVIDTKWKQPENNSLHDADLKQMFVYNDYWQSRNAYLLYPNQVHTAKPIHIEGYFSRRTQGELPNRCGIIRLSVLNENNNGLDYYIGKKMVQFINGELKK